MARVNIEESIFKDNRFIQLCIKLGGLDPALGALTHAWIVAQDWFLSPEQAIPSKEWVKQGLNEELINVGLANRVDEKIKMAGAEDQFAWLRQRSDSGKKGGPAASKARIENKGEFDRRKSSEVVGDRRATSSFSSSFSFSESKEKKEEKKAPDLLEKSQIEACGKTWLATLEHLGVKRSRITPVEEMDIARGIQQYGVEYVELVLFGSRLENKSDDFDPGKHASTRRSLFSKNKQGEPFHQKFHSLGDGARNKGRLKQLTDEENEK